VGTVLVAFPIWTVELANFITPFLVVPFVLALPVWLLVAIVASLGLLGFGIWQRSILAPLPSVLLVLSALTAWYVPTDELFYRVEFELLYDARQQVVDEIEAGERRPNVECCESLIRIEGRGRILSRGYGEVLYDERDGEAFIFFFTYHGILDNYEGFMYRSGPEEPERCFSGETALTIVKMRDHWYWMSCT